MATYTKCTKMFFLSKNVENEKKVLFNLSTLKTVENVKKRFFLQSYSHYPHKNMKIRWITLENKRTNVLYTNDENRILSKKVGKIIDF